MAVARSTVVLLGTSEGSGITIATTANGIVTRNDEPPVPEVVRRRAYSFSTQPAAGTGTPQLGVMTSAAVF
jgi:hypothetical protein